MPEKLHLSNDDRWWDYYSDQPYVLDKHNKPRFTSDHLIESAKTLATLIGVSPFLLWRYLTVKQTPLTIPTRDFVGLSISPNFNYSSEIIEMVDELDVEQLLFRIPVWKTDHLDDYLKFAEKFTGKNLLINILQNRDSVINPEQWKQQVNTIISNFQPLAQTYQIGNAINRSKWGCHTTADYFTLQNQVEKLRTDFPEIKILGSSVIDFEPMATLRTLINNQPYHLDGCASLLYVNRRLSPFNKQFGVFDLERKIRLIYTILSLSNKSDKKLWITENNWPLLNTKPYTPNSGNPRSTVDEQTQATFLKQYYQIAYQTGMVKKVYWWQLINPGYGLVDSREKRLRKMPSYYAFKELIESKL